VIYNDGIHAAITDPAFRSERQLVLEHGKPMLFGAENEKGIVFDKGRLKVAVIGENGITIDDILVHDATEEDPTLHMALINMKLPDMPVAFGVIRSVAAPVYDIEMVEQINQVQKTRKIKNVDELLNSGNIWEVEGKNFKANADCPKNRTR
jgi:2-oxoglutarate ferredoxin oxidoreductase subunit beta